ncbi:hypothetical protein [Prochlorococcus sp. SS52]|uniref:hypothetical protein n=1 Tax=Prochlorococcus sp. SS52 TaxID=1499501 RepID=UPI0039A42360
MYHQLQTLFSLEALIGATDNFSMDILLIHSDDNAHIRAASIHKMLWLQTHFEASQWEAIASEEVMLTKDNAEMLANDAMEAGLILNSVPSVSFLSKN